MDRQMQSSLIASTIRFLTLDLLFLTLDLRFLTLDLPFTD
jgi:hypothetical protein